MSDTHEVVAVYFPSWHTNDHYQAWYGRDFSEWELMKTSKPLFPGHQQPKIPTWGYFDESDPTWAAREIDLAADHGITTFMFDWYWYSGVRIMEEALERGFLYAPNRHRLKFCLMWANHSWGTWPAMTDIPGMRPTAGVNQGQSIWLPSRHDMEDLDRVVDYCSEHYFQEPNYWRINDKPVYVMWDVNHFMDELGGSDTARAGLARMHDRAQRNGMPGLYFIANVGFWNDSAYCCGYDRTPMLHDLGFQSVYAYNIVRTPQFSAIPDEMPTVQYDDVIASHQHVWNEIEKWGVPHHPVVTVGCDVTPRWHRGVSLPMKHKELGYEPIIVNNTPDKFGKLCSMALEQMLKNPEPHAIWLNAWNEWSEGMHLLPDQYHGTGYLEALREALRTFNASLQLTPVGSSASSADSVTRTTADSLTACRL